MTAKIAMKTSALAFVLIIGTPERFKCGKQIGSYVGLIPCEDSSAGHQRLGHITKQGSSLLRFLLGEAAQAAARCDSDLRRRYIHSERCLVNSVHIHVESVARACWSSGRERHGASQAASLERGCKSWCSA